MTTKADDSAYPTTRTTAGGLTKRERFALEIQGRLITDHDFIMTVKAPKVLEVMAAKQAVKGADALIDALNGVDFGAKGGG